MEPKNNIGAIIVMSDDNPVGIITEMDIIEKIVRVGKDPDETRAEEIMTSPSYLLKPIKL